MCRHLPKINQGYSIYLGNINSNDILYEINMEKKNMNKKYIPYCTDEGMKEILDNIKYGINVYNSVNKLISVESKRPLFLNNFVK